MKLHDARISYSREFWGSIYLPSPTPTAGIKVQILLPQFLKCSFHLEVQGNRWGKGGGRLPPPASAKQRTCLTYPHLI